MHTYLQSRTVIALCLTASLGMLNQTAVAATSFDRTFSLDQFANYKNVVREYLQKRNPDTPGDACVIGLIADDHSKFAWVLWEQGGELILYEDGETDLSHSRRRLNLKKDVVAEESDLHGSTYLITEEWLRQLRTACRRHGVEVHIDRRHSALR